MIRRRILQAVQVALAAAALGFFVALMAGSTPGAEAAAPDASTTPSTTCTRLVCGGPTTTAVLRTTLPPTTSPATTAAQETTTPTTSAPRTVAPYSRQTYPTSVTVPSTTTTLTTIPGIGGHLPVAPSTLPFTTKQQSSHVSPVFAALSGAGFFAALLIVGVRFLLTRPGRR